MDRFKPAVSPTVLLFLAGAVWLCVGGALLLLARSWLNGLDGTRYLFAGAGVIAGLLAHHFGFLRIVDRNIARILAVPGKPCLFAFIPWKSYLLVAVMIAGGAVLRHSAIPKPYLAMAYAAVGLGLLLSSVRYLRVFLREIRK